MSVEQTQGSEKKRNPLRVAVIGVSNWLDVLSELFRRAGIASEVIHTNRGEAWWKWFLSCHWWELRVLRKFDAIHHVGGACHWRPAMFARLLRRPIVFHWIGTDILNYRAAKPRSLRGILYRLAAHRWAAGHLVDSPKLAKELAELGIHAIPVATLPKWIEADVEPLPPEFTVLSYWFDTCDRKAFYGGDIVLQLADAFPDVQFNILGSSGVGEPERPNVRFLGFREDMDVVYREASVLIRLPKHDSTAKMPMEMLVRGRYVIYNVEFDGCHYANNFEEARQALLEVMELREPNMEGANIVKSRYNLDREAESLRKSYEEFMGGDWGKENG